MKLLQPLLCALAASIALLAGRASAAPVQTLPVSTLSLTGITAFITTNYYKLDKKGTNIVDTNWVTVAKSQSFNTKTIYNIISNAVANATNYSTNLVSMTLPADGYIVFNPLVYDGYVRGVFYVTNNSGFTYQLSGFDSSFNYYSWIELDAEVPVYPPDVDFNNIGFGNNFDLTYNSNFDQKTGDDTVSGTASALLFIHDDPYSYDDADHTYEYWEDNSIGIEIRGIIKTIETYKGGTVTQWTGKLSGSGSINVEDGNYGEVTSGSATFAK